jgi:hypothetical protein
MAVDSKYFIFDVDTNQSKLDSIKIKNDGYIPLHYSITDTASIFPAWLALPINDGTIAAEDSIYVKFTINDPWQPTGDYYTILQITSNDYQTGNIYISIAIHVGTNRTFSVNVQDKWNMVSIPVISETRLKTELFPTAISDAYSYNEAYVTKDSLTRGTGYWIKFDEDQPITFHGYVFQSDIIDVVSGWNLIGTISNTLPVTNIITSPPDIMSSYFFGYTTGYNIADSLHPGKGYWIQVTEPGTIIMNGDFPPLTKKISDPLLPILSSITISESKLLSQILYFSSAPEAGAKKFMMPPQSPNDFDVRFSDGTMAVLDKPGENSEYPIYISSKSSSLTLRWDVKTKDEGSYNLQSEDGAIVKLIGKGEIKVTPNPSGTTVIKLIAHPKGVPAEFALHQNYPNPFNPTTRIEYDMPISGDVSLKLYNILGSEILTIFNGYSEAGYHAITVDATNIPSGIYFLKMVSGKYTAVRKLVLAK